MATSVGAREGHSSGWGGRVVGGEEQAPEGSNGHLSASQGEGHSSGWGGRVVGVGNSLQASQTVESPVAAPASHGWHL